jgi:hypothetical protein
LADLTAAAAASETAFPVVASFPVREKIVMNFSGLPAQDAEPGRAEFVDAGSPPEELQAAMETTAASASATVAAARFVGRADHCRTCVETSDPNLLTIGSLLALFRITRCHLA